MEFTVDSSLTGHGELNLEVAPGTALSHIIDVAGIKHGTAVWCGSEQLSGEHPAGTHPLIHGARLAACAADETVIPRGPYVAVVAGPDSGAVVPLNAQRTWGREGTDVVVDDPAMSRLHASIAPHAMGAHIRDARSTNGWQLWDRDSRVRGAVLSMARTARLGDTWIAVRHVPAPPDNSEARKTPSGRGQVTAMVGAGASSLVLAAVTGRWYLALFAMVLPAVALGPALAARLRRPVAWPLKGMPDPTRVKPALSTRGGDGDEASTAPTVAITGLPAQRDALARAVILDRGRKPPAHPNGVDEPWLRWLPDALPSDGPVLVLDDAPSWCDIEYRATPAGTVVAPRGSDPHVGPPLAVSLERADAAARRIAGATAHSALPTQSRWADIAGRAAPDPSEARSFAFAMGMTRPALASGAGALAQPWVLDLDAHGPHFVVAGTTGSGKSALLETLVLAACHAHSPQDLQVALIDFKGGAGLAACMDLPHVAGVVTDLDGRDARRALAALADEVAHRKAQLLAAGHASFKDWERHGDALPRLLVVVDEFQEIGLLHREFMPDLTRIAAQGRSLGMHVVLATQRPAGAVTPEIRANTATTIALRVASEAESRDLVGTIDAALIDPRIPGRAIVAHGAQRLEVQVALPVATRTPAVRHIPARGDEAVTHLADVVRDKWNGASNAAPLWHPALPASVDLEELIARDMTGGAAGAVLGIEDWPRERKRDVLRWQPSSGPALVVGPPTESRLAILASVAESSRSTGLTPVWLPTDPREAARTMWLCHQRTDVVVVVPDAALALQALATVDRGAPAEALLTRASAGLPLAVGMGAGTHHRIANSAAMKIVMTGLSDQDEALWSIPRDLADVGHAPGAVRVWTSHGWREARVALTERGASHALVASLPIHLTPDHTGNDAPHHGLPCLAVGGDDATQIIMPPGSEVLVVGAPGPERDEVLAALDAAQARATTVDSPVFIPPQARGGVVVVLEPTSRVAEDLCKSSGWGLVDATPIPGRVLWVEGGVGKCAQLRLPATHPSLRLAG